jgi:hypothetical protein
MSVKRQSVGVAIAAIFSAAILSPAASAETFRVGVDQTVTLQLASPADSVVIGNATIADVTVHDPNTLLVTGKAFGSTNILVLGRGGHTIYSNTIAVSGGSGDQLTIVRGPGTFTYSCIEKCRGTPVVGDDPAHFDQIMQTVEAMSGAARGGQ